MVVGIWPAANKAMLIEIADFGGEPLRDRRVNRDQAPDPIKSRLLLERRGVEVDEGLGA